MFICYCRTRKRIESLYLLHVQVRVQFHCHQRDQNKQLTFVKYIDVIKPLDNTEDLLGWLVSRWSTDNDGYHTSSQVVLNRKKPPAPWYDIKDFQNTRSVVQVVR